MEKINIDKLISEMTLEEKASLCSAADAWHTKRIDRLNLPSAMVSDGPHDSGKRMTVLHISDFLTVLKPSAFQPLLPSPALLTGSL